MARGHGTGPARTLREGQLPEVGPAARRVESTEQEESVALEIGHESFACTAFVDLCREANVAIVWCEQESRTSIADRTADFAYVRCKKAQDGEPAGYPAAELDRIAALCLAWDRGEAPADLPYAGEPAASKGMDGDVFCFMIAGAKHRNPAAAMALADTVKGSQ